MATARVSACLTAIVLAIAGCGGSSASTVSTGSTTSTAPSNPTSSNGAASFVGQATNAEVFIQWTRSGNSVSGSLQEAIRKERGSSAVESSGTAFTGTVAGNGLTLSLNEGLGSTKALVGQVTPTGFTMTFPGVGHALTDITFVPGEVSDYNHAVEELEGRAEQGPSSEGSSTTTNSTGGFTVTEHCGSIEGPGGHFAITTDDNVGCPEARGVFRDLFAGRGERHEDKDEAETYTDVDGWTCGSGTGGFGCKRLLAYIGANSE